MKTKKVITLQNVKVLEEIMNKGIYKTNKSFYEDNCLSMYESVEDMRYTVEKYSEISNYLNYEKDTIPIFGLLYGSIGVAYGASYNYEQPNDVLLELDVPSELVNIHDFDLWDNYYSDFDDKITMESIFGTYEEGDETLFTTCNFETVIPYIKKEWINNYSTDKGTIQAFISNHIFVGYGSTCSTVDKYKELSKYYKD